MATNESSDLVDIIPDTETSRLKIELNLKKLPSSLRMFFDQDGLQNAELEPVELFEQLNKSRFKNIRISQEVRPWLDALQRSQERIENRCDYETSVIEGRYPEHVTLSPRFPYQREGMLHLGL